MRLPIGDVRLHVSVFGEEWRQAVRHPVIIALHGGPGIDGAKMRLLMHPASEYAQVIVPDQRGHGRSDLSEPTHWNLDTWADDLAALVEVLGVEKPIVLGSSFGGFVVQRYLARHPDQPAAAVLIATSSGFGDQEATIERFRQVGGDEAAAVMARGFEEYTLEAEQEWARVCGPLLARRPLNPELARALVYRVNTPQVNLHFMARNQDMDLRPGLIAVRCPVLIVAGEHDPLIAPQATYEMTAALPQGIAEQRTVLDAAHDLLSDQPEIAHSLIRDFIKRVAPGSW